VGGASFIRENSARKASQKVSGILTKKIGAQLSFTGVGFDIFPPSTVFKNVQIAKKDPLTADVSLIFEELRVSFTYASFFSSELEIDNLISRMEPSKLPFIRLKIRTPIGKI